MIKGNIDKINLSSSSFERMITEGMLYIDKTKLIENFLNNPSDVQLVARQRRLGKSLNMDMLRCFLTDREDLQHLFKGLYIESSDVWGEANSSPVFYFDFKELQPDVYREQIIDKMVDHVCSLIDPENLDFALKRKFTQIIDNPARATDCLRFLTEVAYKVTGKRSYLLIDEYDKLLMDNYSSGMYDDVRSFETALLSAGLKGNPYLEKAMLTGVMRISHESMFSGLNNIRTFDVFDDETYVDDYGLTEDEVVAINSLEAFDIDEVRAWYNGVRIGGKPIYNIYSMMSYLSRKRYGCYWGRSGTMDIIADLLDDSRRSTLVKLFNNEKVNVPIVNRISLRDLSQQSNDQAFYSLLVQAGYLAVCTVVSSTDSFASVSIPNMELQIVWKQFILEKLYSNAANIRTLFDNADNLDIFSKDLEYFLCDRLSYHDLAVISGEDRERVHERLYHIFLLGLLSAYDDVHCQYPLSNRESGDGRYDVLVEKSDANFIFEFKTAKDADSLTSKAQEALAQIETKRYGANLNDEKKLFKIGIAFCGKKCRVLCSV